MLDNSRSMKAKQRNRLSVFLGNLVDTIGVSSKGNHFAAVTFDRNARIVNKFNDTQYHNKTNLKARLREAIQSKPQKHGARTDLAMNLAVNSVFIPEGGDRPNATNVMIIVTDGKPWISSGDKEPLIEFAQSTKAIEVMHISPQSYSLQ